jgi:ATP-binding cassette subfamily A (ABC1) protein 3
MVVSIAGYYDEGFLYLQQAIDMSLARIILPANDSKRILEDYTIKLQRFPYPPYIDDKFLFTLQGILPIVLILSFLFPVVNIIKSVIIEKERRLKVNNGKHITESNVFL